MERVKAEMDEVADELAGSCASWYIDLTAWRNVVRSASLVWKARRTLMSSRG